MQNYKLFIRSMRVMGKKRFVYLGSIFVMSVTFALFGIMSSLLMKCVVDIAQTGEYERLGYSIAVIVAVGVISLLIYRVATIRYNVEAKRVYGDLSEKVLDAEMSLPYSYYEKHHSGEIVSKVSYDLTKMGDIYGSRLRRVVMPFLQVVSYLIPMFLLSWQLTLCLLAVNSVMMAIELLLLNPMHRVSRELSGINTAMTNRLSDLLQGMEQVRMFSGGRGTVAQFREENHHYEKKYGRKTLYTACLEGSSKGFELLCSLVFLMLGIYYVDKGYTTLGALAAIYTMYASFSLPKIINNNMKFCYIKSLNELIPGKYNIPEPINNNYVNDFDSTICIVPGICYDKKNFRVGYGKGYYDKFLSKHKIKTIGLCYKECLIEKIDTDKFDYKIDEVITD